MAEALYKKYKSRGFVIINVLLTSYQSDTVTWAKTYGLTFPVLADLDRLIWIMYNDLGYIPLNMVLGRDLVIYYKDIGFDEQAVEDKIVELLNK